MSRRNSGRIAQMTDGRKVIIRHNQPLLKEKGKVVLYLIDDDFRPVIGDDNKEKTLLMDVQVFNELVPTWKPIGMID